MEPRRWVEMKYWEDAPQQLGGMKSWNFTVCQPRKWRVCPVRLKSAQWMFLRLHWDLGARKRGQNCFPACPTSIRLPQSKCWYSQAWYEWTWVNSPSQKRVTSLRASESRSPSNVESMLVSYEFHLKQFVCFWPQHWEEEGMAGLWGGVAGTLGSTGHCPSCCSRVVLHRSHL